MPQIIVGYVTAARRPTLGLAGGQRVYGPLADRFGRRPVLMAGLSLYALAGLAAMLAPSLNALIAARLFQALGGCSGLVLARAIVHDTSTPKDATRRLAMMNLMVTVGSGAAPLVGGLLADVTGWRSNFGVLTVRAIPKVTVAIQMKCLESPSQERMMHRSIDDSIDHGGTEMGEAVNGRLGPFRLPSGVPR